jgi:hypothetical protein
MGTAYPRPDGPHGRDAAPTLDGRGRTRGDRRSLSFIVGPAIAGVLTGLIGPAQTLALDALSFLASGLALTFVHRSLRESAGRRDSHIVADIVHGIRYIATERTLRMVVAFWGAVSVISAPLVPAVIFYLTIDRAQSAQVVGAVLSGYGVGYFVGAIISGRFAKGRLGLFMIAGNAVQAIVLISFGVSNALPLWVAGAFLAGVSGALVLIAYITLRATIPPDELLGRVGSTARTISLGLGPIGLLIGGLLLDRIGGSSTIVLIAVAVLLVTALFALSPSIRSAVMRAHDRPGTAPV